MTDTERNLLSRYPSDYLRAMQAKAERAAQVHHDAFRPYMAQLCETRAANCATLITEREA